MEIKYSHLKAIASTTMNLSAINLFDKNFKQLSMNSRIEVAKFEPEPTFENTVNEIKNNHLKSIASSAMNVVAITLFGDNFEHIIMNSRIEVEKFDPEPPLENTIDEIKANHLKIITFVDKNVSAITLKNPLRLLNI